MGGTAPPPPDASPPPGGTQWTAPAASAATPVPGAAGFVYADVPNSAIAYIIDAIILGIVIGFIAAAIVAAASGIGPRTYALRRRTSTARATSPSSNGNTRSPIC
jgi:hypothetical protein